MWGTWNNLSNSDFDRGSPSLKDVKVNQGGGLQGWAKSGGTHRAKLSDNSFNWVRNPGKPIPFSSLLWKQTFSDTSGILVVFRVTGWCTKVRIQVCSEIKQAHFPLKSKVKGIQVNSKSNEVKMRREFEWLIYFRLLVDKFYIDIT